MVRSFREKTFWENAGASPGLVPPDQLLGKSRTIAKSEILNRQERQGRQEGRQKTTGFTMLSFLALLASLAVFMTLQSACRQVVNIAEDAPTDKNGSRPRAALF